MVAIYSLKTTAPYTIRLVGGSKVSCSPYKVTDFFDGKLRVKDLRILICQFPPKWGRRSPN
jgi:hypothetical protein